MGEITLYSVSSSKSKPPGLRLPDSFYKENTQWANAVVKVEVLSEKALLVRVVTEEEMQAQAENDDDEENPIMMRMFLDFIMEDVLKNPDKLVTYTEEMKAEEDELLKGVTLDYDEEDPEEDE